MYGLRNIELPADESLIRGWLSQSRISDWWGAEDEAFAHLRERAAAQQAALLQDTKLQTAIGCVCLIRLPGTPAAQGVGRTLGWRKPLRSTSGQPRVP